MGSRQSTTRSVVSATDKAESYLSIAEGGNNIVGAWGRSTRDERAYFNP